MAHGKNAERSGGRNREYGSARHIGGQNKGRKTKTREARRARRDARRTTREAEWLGTDRETIW